MKLSEWAKQQRISYRTAWRWFKSGVLPVCAKQLANGTILISEQETKNLVGIYTENDSRIGIWTAVKVPAVRRSQRRPYW